MKQPDLGKKIAELRRVKSLTQEELVAKCNINVRTLQRIESGEVFPRSYTVKLIFAALDYNDSPENISMKISEPEHVTESRLDKLYKSAIDIFNLKTNKMKKISIIATLLFFIGIGLFFIISDIKAQRYTVVIDAGHGGQDGGVQITNKVLEKNITLSIAKLLKEKTKNKTDFKLFLTRDTDQFVALGKRIDEANKTRADLFLSIHVNSSSDKELSGIECYSAFDSGNKTESEHIGRLLVDELKDLKGIGTHDSIYQADFKVLKDSQCPALLLNIGYLSNSNDLSYLSDIHNQRLICDKIIKAIGRIEK